MRRPPTAAFLLLLLLLFTLDCGAGGVHQPDLLAASLVRALTSRNASRFLLRASEVAEEAVKDALGRFPERLAAAARVGETWGGKVPDARELASRMVRKGWEVATKVAVARMLHHPQSARVEVGEEDPGRSQGAGGDEGPGDGEGGGDPEGGVGGGGDGEEEMKSEAGSDGGEESGEGDGKTPNEIQPEEGDKTTIATTSTATTTTATTATTTTTTTTTSSLSTSLSSSSSSSTHSYHQEIGTEHTSK